MLYSIGFYFYFRITVVAFFEFVYLFTYLFVYFLLLSFCLVCWFAFLCDEGRERLRQRVLLMTVVASLWRFVIAIFFFFVKGLRFVE